MKKTILAIAVVSALLSCSKENPELVTTGSISFKPIIESTAKFDKKDGEVNRASIPVYVSSIDVFTENTAGSTNTTFTLVATNGESDFIIENLPLGETTISAVSESNSQQLHQISHFNNKDEAQIQANAYNPYVVYSSINNPLVNLTSENTENVDISMETENARLIMYFYTEDGSNISESYNLRISADYNNNEITEILSDAGVILYYWSNEDAVAQLETSIKVEWVDKNSPSEVVRTDQFTYALKKGISSSVNVIIKEKEISTATSNMSFAFTPILERQESDLILDGNSSTPEGDPVINLDFLKYDDETARTIGANGEIIGKTVIGDFVWYAEDMTGASAKTLAETNFYFDIECDKLRITLYLSKDGTNIYRSVSSNADFAQLKIDYADYIVRTDYTRSFWGSTNVNFLLRLGDDDYTVQQGFTVSLYEQN
ncbi:MAG: hypothetical protein KAH10_06645 [Flavobacteriales bacterium]|nr:hypothetical protein [Flavobacteriales bacterium]